MAEFVADQLVVPLLMRSLPKKRGIFDPEGQGVANRIDIDGAEIRTGAVDLVVTDMAVIGFPDGRATLMETAPGVSAAGVIANAEAEFVVPSKVPEMAI